MTTWLTGPEQQLWRDLWQVTDALREELHRDLQARHGISLADYEILGRLSAATAGARVKDLMATLAWEQSRISHQLTRLVKVGLVEKTPCEEDRRGHLFRLTEPGQAALDAAAPDHVDLVRKSFFNRLSDHDQQAMRQALHHLRSSREVNEPDLG